MWGTRDWWGSKLQGLGYYGEHKTAGKVGGNRTGAPRTSVRGTKEIFFECFWFDTEKTIEGLRPSFPAHVRCSERGAPVQFPPKFPGSVAIALFGSEVGGLIDELEAYRHEPEG
jgi:hypothetical protein